MVKILQRKISISPIFQCYLENPGLVNACFPLPHHLPFSFQTSDQPILTNRFQIIDNKPNETPYVILQTIVLKNKLSASNLAF